MEIENHKIAAQCWAAISARGPALLAWPSGIVAQPTHASRCYARSALSPRDGMVVRLHQWPRCSVPRGLHGGATAVAPGKVGRRDSHRRWPAAMEWRKRPDVSTFQGSGGAPVVGEGVNESYSWSRGRGR
jgi:hypothetical protein